MTGDGEGQRTQFCGACGQEALLGDAFCRACGARVALPGEPGASVADLSAAPQAHSVEDLLTWSQRRNGESTEDHLLRIRPFHPGESWTEGEKAAFEKELGAIERPSIRELVDRYWGSNQSIDQPSRTCRSCFAYTHRYLEACAGCGRHIGAQVSDLAMIKTRAHVLRAVVRDQTDLAETLSYTREKVTDNVALWWGWESALTPREYVEKGLENSKAAARDGLDIDPAPMLRAFGRLEYRYLGGLASYPSPMDVRLVPQRRALAIVARGMEIAALPYAHILGAWPFPQDVPVSKTRFGLIGNGFMYFPDPTYHGGGLAIAAVLRGDPVVVAVGNRSGWLTAKGDLQFYASLSIALSVTCSFEAGQREQEVGPSAFAEELALDIGQPPD